MDNQVITIEKRPTDILSPPMRLPRIYSELAEMVVKPAKKTSLVCIGAACGQDEIVRESSLRSKVERHGVLALLFGEKLRNFLYRLRINPRMLL